MISRNSVATVTILLLTVTLVGCVEKQGSDTPDGNDQIRSAIQEQNKKFMETLRNGNMEAFSTVFIEESGKMMPPGRPAVIGRDSIIQFMQNMRKNGVSKINLTTQELYPMTNHAIEVGKYEVFMGDTNRVDYGKYMVYWKKYDGKWRIYRDIWNSSRPAATSSQ